MILRELPGSSRVRVLLYMLVLQLHAVSSCAPGWSAARPVQLDAWLVYFDAERGLAELRQHGRLFDRVSLFAYELDPEGNILPAPGVREFTGRFHALARQLAFEPWVTVVNDVRYGTDNAVAKDSKVVHRLITDAELRATHVNQLAERVAADGFAGLHLDYEQVPESDATHFREFVTELSAALQGRGLGLEVILEPARGPMPELNSARITVMAYDLFGAHSGPGPRSTPEFVSELSTRAALDADSAAALALAVGGFAWDPDGEVRSVDWSDAKRLAVRASDRRRGELDRVPSARLDDGSELFFEDAESLAGKWEAAWVGGFRRLAIWRLGGNDEGLFNFLRKLTPRR